MSEKLSDEQLAEMGLSPEEIEALREEGEEGADDDDGQQEGAHAGAEAGDAGGAATGSEGDGGGNGSEAGGAAAGSGEGGAATGSEGAAKPQSAQATAASAREPDPRIGEIEAELNALDGKFDDGDLTASEYRTQQKELAKELEDLRWNERSHDLRRQIETDQRVKQWGDDIRSFLAEDDHLKFYGNDYSNPSLPYRALDAAVQQVQDEHRAAGLSDTDPEILRKAHNMVLEQFGIQSAAAGGGSGQQATPKVAHKPAVPTLAKVPAAAIADTDGTQWAWLDRIRDNPDPDDPERYEREVAALPKDKRDSYMAAAG